LNNQVSGSNAALTPKHNEQRAIISAATEGLSGPAAAEPASAAGIPGQVGAYADQAVRYENRARVTRPNAPLIIAASGPIAGRIGRLEENARISSARRCTSSSGDRASGTGGRHAPQTQKWPCNGPSGAPGQQKVVWTTRPMSAMTAATASS